MDEIQPIYQQSFTEIRSKKKERNKRTIYFLRLSPRDLDLQSASLKFTSSRLLVKDYQPAKFEDDGMINDREISE